MAPHKAAPVLRARLRPVSYTHLDVYKRQVLNGTELGGGSIRIHRSDVQQRMFKALGFEEADIQERFGHMIEAFRYGAPPHGGLAYGLDRLVMLMAGRDSIRDVIAFPKVQNASDLMMHCPSPVDQKQLKELSIALDIPERCV